MLRKVAMAIMALSVGGCFILTSPPASAQPGQQQQKGKTQGHVRGGKSAVAPRGRGATHRATPRATHRATPRATRRATPRATRRATPRATRRATPRATRTVTPRGSRAVIAGKLRGVSRTAIHGRNYSVWRGRHRIRHSGGWWTLSALSALGAIIVGSDQYYPYAYISAPENYCEGLTEDGCQLMWQEVETIEGDVIDQCVAYCPWR